MAGNETLARAGRAKNDEFYTQLPDIEAELRHYRDQLRGKVVFCNCDDPYESGFFTYFAMNFNHLGLKKLITTSYAESSVAGSQLPLREIASLPGSTPPRAAYRVEITEVPDANHDGAIDLSDVRYLLKNDRNSLTLLAGDGDFRSAEAVALLDEADIVVTNPPFSLFREYVAQLISHGKQFLVLGNQNALTYREIFPLIMDNQIWLGYENYGNKWFRVPDNYTHTTTESHIKVNNGVRYLKMRNITWFTNLDTVKRHEFLTLYRQYSPEEYPTYVNYPAVEISRIANVPADYDSAMGVPITFLDKYNPDQFEILGNSRDLGTAMSSIAAKGTYQQGGPRFYLPNGDGTYRRMYDRIAIKRKSPA